MTEDAKRALTNIGTNRIGSTTIMSKDVAVELKELGYIGKDRGLTRKGSIVRQKQEDVDLFA